MQDRVVRLISSGVAVSILSLLALADAREPPISYVEQPESVPLDAFELKMGAGYSQGIGKVTDERALPDLAGAGLVLHLDADYRWSPSWSLGVEGQYQGFVNEQTASARGLATSVGATHHFMPARRGDPWLRLGTGYRLLWEDDPSADAGWRVLGHGLELATAKLGYDVRVSPDVAFAPVLGADLDLFLWQASSTRAHPALSRAQVGTFFFIGLQGRFDVGGSRARARRASGSP